MPKYKSDGRGPAKKGKINRYEYSETNAQATARGKYKPKKKIQTTCNMCVSLDYEEKLKVICEGSEYKLCKKCYYMAFAAQLSANIPLSHLINL